MVHILHIHIHRGLVATADARSGFRTIAMTRKTKDVAEIPMGTRVKIKSGMKEFIGKTGEISHKQGNSYRIKFSPPVQVPGLGAVKDDLWERSGFTVLSPQIADSAYDRDLKDNEPRVVEGVKGMNSKPFRKRFPNAAAMDRWMDSAEAEDCQVHYIRKAN